MSRVSQYLDRSLAIAPLNEALVVAARQAERIELGFVALIATACADRFGVGVGALYARLPAHRPRAGLNDVALARACVVTVLHCGAGWAKPRAAEVLGFEETALRRALRRVADLRDRDPDLDAFLESLERAAQGEPGRQAADAAAEVR